jgi:hypothetical protein
VGILFFNVVVYIIKLHSTAVEKLESSQAPPVYCAGAAAVEN